mgnify:FL=1
MVTQSEVKAVRWALGLTQADFAGILGLDAMTVSRLERGLTSPNSEVEAIVAGLLPLGQPMVARLGAERARLAATRGTLAAKARLLAFAVEHREEETP